MAWSIEGNAYDTRYASLDCKEEFNQQRLNCTYTVTERLKVSNVLAIINGQPVKIEKKSVSEYPSSNDEPALLILIDTSDPRRNKSLQQFIKPQVAKIIKEAFQKIPKIKIGLSTFDSNLTEVSAIGKSKIELLDGLSKIKCDGQSTAFYKSILDAIVNLEKAKSNRKGIILISDGKNEDKAYTHLDVIKAAERAGIMIEGIGYSEKPVDETYLQTLERLSNESYGKFINASSIKNGDDVSNNALAFISGGGHFSVDSSKLYGNLKIEAILGLTSNDKIKLESSAQVKDRRNNYQKFVDIIKMYWEAILGISVFLVIIMILSRRFIGRKIKPELNFGSLYELGSSETKYPINKSSIKIGRAQDNDICIKNTSVSSYHTELHFRRDGVLQITDLGSTNGTVLNGSLITKALLSDGDVIELGDVRLSYSKN